MTVAADCWGEICYFCVDVQVNILSVLFAFLLNSEVFLTVNYVICEI
jgi:hypothetical protein